MYFAALLPSYRQLLLDFHLFNHFSPYSNMSVASSELSPVKPALDRVALVRLRA